MIGDDTTVLCLELVALLIVGVVAHLLIRVVEKIHRKIMRQRRGLP